MKLAGQRIFFKKIVILLSYGYMIITLYLI